ncbi:MAG: hypothetical protein R3350_06505 [Saprospiraceae bacterium]|nr:hypothetical protein [Saprospiraceae bacterium]
MRKLRDLRLFFHRHLLNRQRRRIEVLHRSVPFDEARQIGILFDASELDHRNAVLQFAKKIRSKRVHLLGYFDSYQDKEAHFPFDFFHSGQIDWALRPKGPAVQRFIENPFDILLVAYPSTTPHSEYIAALSRATLRVGPVTENTYCYELMIDAGRDNQPGKFLADAISLLKKTTTQYETA